MKFDPDLLGVGVAAVAIWLGVFAVATRLRGLRRLPAFSVANLAVAAFFLVMTILNMAQLR